VTPVHGLIQRRGAESAPYPQANPRKRPRCEARLFCIQKLDPITSH
jgi:hypothetical protein